MLNRKRVTLTSWKKVDYGQVYFELGGSHNAIEVSEDTYNANLSTPTINGFEFGYGESGFLIPLETKTYFYVCTPHLPEMKGKIIVN